MKALLMTGALLMALGVGLGAFGAHGLRDVVSERMLQNWQTGVLYHLIHALGIVAMATLLLKVGMGQFQLAGWLMVAGIFFFSGSLYVMALTGVTKLGAITPIGGVLFIAAWIVAMVGAFKL